jgi:hypothetical protein
VHFAAPPFAHCKRPLSDRVSVVSGDRADRVDDYCVNERKAGRTRFGFGRERCGPGGQFFQRRPSATLAPQLRPSSGAAPPPRTPLDAAELTR